MTNIERLLTAFAEIQQVLDRHNVKLSTGSTLSYARDESLWIVDATDDRHSRCVATAGTWTPIPKRVIG